MTDETFLARNAGDRHAAQRLGHKGEEVGAVGAVGALSVRAASVQLELQELGIAGD